MDFIYSVDKSWIHFLVVTVLIYMVASCLLAEDARYGAEWVALTSLPTTSMWFLATIRLPRFRFHIRSSSIIVMKEPWCSFSRLICSWASLRQCFEPGYLSFHLKYQVQPSVSKGLGWTFSAQYGPSSYTYSLSVHGWTSKTLLYTGLSLMTN